MAARKQLGKAEPSKALLRRSKKLKAFLLDRFTGLADGFKDKQIAIPMSAGVDSHTALYTALEAEVEPVIFSFHLEGVESRDFRIAEAAAAHHDLKFVEVVIPSDPKQLVKDAKALAVFGCRSKTDFECFWPMWYLIPAMARNGIKVFFTGHGADSLYCMSRKATQHFKGREDEFREQAFSSKKAFQQHLIKKLCKRYDMEYCPIFYSPEILPIFKGATPKDLHYPIQKSVSRFAYPEQFAASNVYTHTSFQLGDSGIAEHFNLLLDSKLNVGDWKSVKGVYNHLVKLATEQ